MNFICVYFSRLPIAKHPSVNHCRTGINSKTNQPIDSRCTMSRVNFKLCKGLQSLATLPRAVCLLGVCSEIQQQILVVFTYQTSSCPGHLSTLPIKEFHTLAIYEFYKSKKFMPWAWMNFPQKEAMEESLSLVLSIYSMLIPRCPLNNITTIATNKQYSLKSNLKENLGEILKYWELQEKNYIVNKLRSENISHCLLKSNPGSQSQTLFAISLLFLLLMKSNGYLASENIYLHCHVILINIHLKKWHTLT